MTRLEYWKLHASLEVPNSSAEPKERSAIGTLPLVTHGRENLVVKRSEVP